MSESSNSVTYEEAVQDENEREDGAGNPGGFFEKMEWDEGTDLEDLSDRFEDVGSFLETLPEGINVGGSESPIDRDPVQENPFLGAIDIEGIENLQQLIQNIDSDIEDVAGNLGDLGQTALLQAQVKTLRSMLTLMLQRSQSDVVRLEALFDILSAVEPLSNITVSGRNAIEQAGVPQPVVPQSDNTLIFTKTLYIRSSVSNNQDIAFGDDEVSPQNGFVLKPGEYINYPIDLRNGVLYMASQEDGATVQILGAV